MAAAPIRPDPAWVHAVQRLAGNRAVVASLGRPTVQRDDPVPTATTTPTAAPAGPGRVPTPQEQDVWDDPLPELKTFRIVREPADGYNCFAWAVGLTSMEITYAMLDAAGYGHNLDGFTKYLAEVYGFGRYEDGLHESADLILYGDSPTQVLHAARRAEEPYPGLGFSSKLGGQRKTPVILHAPAEMQGGSYGNALRSFWRGSASPAVPEAAVPQP